MLHQSHRPPRAPRAPRAKQMQKPRDYRTQETEHQKLPHRQRNCGLLPSIAPTTETRAEPVKKPFFCENVFAADIAAFEVVHVDIPASQELKECLAKHEMHIPGRFNRNLCWANCLIWICMVLRVRNDKKFVTELMNLIVDADGSGGDLVSSASKITALSQIAFNICITDPDRDHISLYVELHQNHNEDVFGVPSVYFAIRGTNHKTGKMGHWEFMYLK